MDESRKKAEKSSAVMRMESEKAREEQKEGRGKRRKGGRKDGRAWRLQDQAVPSVLGFS